MRKPLLIFILVILFVFESNAQNVTITDDNFLQALVNSGVDTNNDGKIQTGEAGKVHKLVVSGVEISDLGGIEAFINLDTLDCSLNQLTSLDLSHNSRLKLLYCSINRLTSLDLSENVALNYLSCSNNKLTTLNVSDNSELILLDCGFNNLTSLNLSANKDLEILECYSNQLDTLNLSENTNITVLFCGNNKLMRLDLSENFALESLDCQFNNLTSLNVSNSPDLKNLACYSNQLTNLDLTNNAGLRGLDCGMNLITSLDLTKIDSLNSADCSQNPNLQFICVRDTALVNANFYFLKDTSAQWTEDCNQTTVINNPREENMVQLFPNPSHDSFTLSAQQPAFVFIYNSFSNMVESHSDVLYLQFGLGYNPGLYFIRILFPGKKSSQVIKIIKN